MTPADPSDPDVIRANARRIAAALDRTTSAHRLPQDALRRVYAVLKEVDSDEPADLQARLRAACHGIEPAGERAFKSALVVLEKMWAVAPNSPAERAAARFVRDCGIACQGVSPELYRLLQKELVERQRSSFPAVRRAAAEARIADPPNAAELKMLAEDRVPHEVRRAIAGRAISHFRPEQVDLQALRSELIDPVLEYVVRSAWKAENAPMGDREDSDSVGWLLRLISARRSQEILALVFRTFVQKAEDPVTSKHLMPILAEYGDSFVRELAEAYRRKPDQRRPIARLLRHMTEHRESAYAAETMLGLITSAHGHELADLAEGLSDASDRLGKRGRIPVELRGVFQEAVDQYGNDPNFILRRMAADLSEAVKPSGERISPELIRRCLEGSVTNSEEWVLRWPDEPTFTLFIEAAVDRNRPVGIRKRAMGLIARVRTKTLRRRSEDVLWQVYATDHDAEAIRITALEWVVNSRRDLSAEDRNRLSNDLTSGPDLLRAAIRRHSDVLFTNEPMDDTPQASPEPAP